MYEIIVYIYLTQKYVLDKTSGSWRIAPLTALGYAHASVSVVVIYTVYMFSYQIHHIPPLTVAVEFCGSLLYAVTTELISGSAKYFFSSLKIANYLASSCTRVSLSGSKAKTALVLLTCDVTCNDLECRAFTSVWQ